MQKVEIYTYAEPSKAIHLNDYEDNASLKENFDREIKNGWRIESISTVPRLESLIVVYSK